MASRNAYLEYKRDTSRIIYWVVGTSNAIIRKLRVQPSTGDTDALPDLNSTGAITSAGLVALSKLISRHLPTTPPAILRLFQSVIGARTQAHTVFQQIVANRPDPDVEKSNASHKNFIDALTAAFNALGGNPTVAAGAKSASDANSVVSKDELDELLLANRFGALDLETSSANQDDHNLDDDDDEEPNATTSKAQRRKQPKPGKGKKGKRSKKPKKAPAVESPRLEDVPLESYRIIQDTDGIMTDYLMAVYDLLRQMAELRGTLQTVWREVAYDGLNSAVAGAVCHVAHGIIQRTASAMFVDFPGHDSFETVMNTITRGDIEKSQGMFSLSLFRSESGDYSQVNEVKKTAIDVKEQFFIHAYQDLVDFVEDFQKTRSGKPTKRMLEQINNWDPTLNLQRATNEQRIQWRRSYIINWLYDLVNVFSSIVVQRNTMKGERHVLENVDWSTTGPWNQHRRLFGLNEFAGFVTSLAMQKPGIDVRKRILPHHVFQLQGIADSLTASRGWTVSALRGHVIDPPARGFRPRRDVDLFLDRENKEQFHSFLQGADVLQQLLDRYATETLRPSTYKQMNVMIEGIQFDFINWLGESKYMHGLNTIPPSRFSKTNSNGLWEYSPYLCAVGLVEGLQLAYSLGMWLWDKLPEITYIIHLHNMLLQKGFIKTPIGLFNTLENPNFFADCFYTNGEPPTSDFAQALLQQTSRAAQMAASRKQAGREVAKSSSSSIHDLLGADLNLVFNVKSLLVTFQTAGWDPDRIPDADVPLVSGIAGLRISRTKRITNPNTGKAELENTELVRRIKELDNKANDGHSGGSLLDAFASTFQSGPSVSIHLPESLSERILPPGYTAVGSRLDGGAGGQRQWGHAGGKEVDDASLLQMLKMEFMRDVCGSSPLSSFNYVWGTARILMIFMQIEDTLREKRNPLYLEAYESPRTFRSLIEKRLALTTMALEGRNDECLREIARIFENPRAGFMNHIYWDDLVDDLELPKTTEREEQERMLRGPPDQMCSMM
ncbi:hypothetical protein B0T16DRAFT_317985 [Cercophora newfieldiana]|uniref:DUF6604 domain-containing protein n=1 Tax=Cercophora newfieldiana TaxID=92897 RepID=A0AA39YUC2_9PEZI|nr:hypothetical protein B0T16DRAFT_317985 [Cercophora newfieldiana]